MKRIISYLYRKYCAPSEVKTMYIKGMQRNFDTPDLTEKEVVERNIAVYNFLQNGWFDRILNEELKNYVEDLFNLCETQEQRNAAYDAINVLVGFEEKFKSYGTQPEGRVEFDKNEL